MKTAFQETIFSRVKPVEPHEFIRLQYRSRRYMKGISDQELEIRAKDILLNKVVLTEENKGILPSLGQGEYWMTLFTQVLEEYALRFGAYPAGFPISGLIDQVRIPRERLAGVIETCERARKRDDVTGTCLFKYGKLSHLKKLQKEGVLRLAPASSYPDPSLNFRGEDQKGACCLAPRPVRSTPHNGKAEKPQSLPRKDRDYYVCCLSGALAPRLFLDFDGDACLVITEPERFIERVFAAFRRFDPEWSETCTPVTYVDPLACPVKGSAPFAYKHFRYSYQNEVRLVWLPPAPVTALKDRFLAVGSLEDCSILISI